MDAGGDNERRKTMEKELTRYDVRNGVSIPVDWPVNELPYCEPGKKTWIVLKDGAVPEQLWRFQIRRYEESEDPASSPYKFLTSGDWRKFASEKNLRAGYKIVIEALETFNLNEKDDQPGRRYTIKVQRKTRNGEWVDIQRPQNLRGGE